MKNVTFEQNPFMQKRGDDVKRNGLEGAGRLVTSNERTGVVVVALEGYSYNPGSRYSGLSSYAKAETAVYVRTRLTDRGIPVFDELVSWETRAPKGGK